MLYNSLEFLLVFLPVCLLVYFLAARISARLANGLLAGMSLVFYIWAWFTTLSQRWTAPRDLMLIVGSIAGNYLVGRWLRHPRRIGRRGVLIAGIAANLAVLIYFKYANFALYNFDTYVFHRPFHAFIPALPLGISFFTFTQIAFLVDAQQVKATDLGFFRYVLFVAFFPHLIAGPIVHHADLMPQFAKPGSKRWNAENVSVGLALLTLGLAKKVMIADTCGPWSNAVFDAGHAVRFLDAWRGTLAYTMQIYFDFSGYCDMAIGLAMLFNVRLPDNFNAPYQAANLTEFWRRWHMTLSRFLRDYLYIPLGGNRRGEGRRKVNVMVTLVIGGIWHGAGWHYIVWGAYHGVALLIQHAHSTSSGRAWKNPLSRGVARGLTFLVVIIGWVFFRAHSLPIALHHLGSMAGLDGAGHEYLVKPVAAAAQWSFLVALLIFVNAAPTGLQWIGRGGLTVRRAVALGVLFFLCVLWIHNANLTHQPTAFIYFQF